MKHFTWLSVGTMIAATITTTGLQASGGVCFHCEEIREYNKTHHKNYEYYEDYLKDQQNAPKENAPQGQSPKSSDTSNTSDNPDNTVSDTTKPSEKPPTKKKPKKHKHKPSKPDSTQTPSTSGEVKG